MDIVAPYPLRGQYPPILSVAGEPAAPVGCWRAKVTSFPFGGFEGTVSWQEPSDLARLREAARGRRRVGERTVDDAERLRSSRERAKRGCRLACKVRNIKRMWTLGTREVLPLYGRGRSLSGVYRRFVVLMQRLGYWVHYVAVPEEHPNGLPGHYHLHVGVADEFIPHDVVLLCWHKALGWKGAEPAKGPQSPGSASWSKVPKKAQHLDGLALVAYIAAYMTKYMLKGDEGGDLNKKRYWVSRAGHPVVFRVWLDCRGTREEAVAQFQKQFAVNLGAEGCRCWLFPDGPGFWVEYAPQDEGEQPPPPF